MHTYAYEGKWSASSPIMNNYSAYGITKPLVVGEFNLMNGATESGTWLYQDVYSRGYNGAWGWDLEKAQWASYLLPGMKSLDGKSGVDFAFASPKPKVQNTCNCADVAPTSEYTCA